MIVCVCHRVSDRDIAREARAGCGSFEDLQFALGVSTGCGRCLECAQATFAEHRAGGTCHAWPAGAVPIAVARSENLPLGLAETV